MLSPSSYNNEPDTQYGFKQGTLPPGILGESEAENHASPRKGMEGTQANACPSGLTIPPPTQAQLGPNQHSLSLVSSSRNDTMAADDYMSSHIAADSS